MREDTAGRDQRLPKPRHDDPFPHLWADLTRAARREARRGLTAFEVTIGVLVTVGFLSLGVRVADAQPSRPLPPAAAYTPAPAVTPTSTPRPATAIQH